jgi:hypothetical protein
MTYGKCIKAIEKRVALDNGTLLAAVPERKD